MARTGVEFGARMTTIRDKQIKLQIWDTVCFTCLHVYACVCGYMYV